MNSRIGAELELEGKNRRDAQLRALAHPERRHLLQCLRAEDPDSVTLSAAVAHVASVGDANYRQVETMMRHHHLAALEAAGIVAYSPHDELLTYIGDGFVTAVLDLLEPGSPDEIDRTFPLRE